MTIMASQRHDTLAIQQYHTKHTTRNQTKIINLTDNNTEIHTDKCFKRVDKHARENTQCTHEETTKIEPGHWQKHTQHQEDNQIFNFQVLYRR